MRNGRVRRALAITAVLVAPLSSTAHAALAADPAEPLTARSAMIELPVERHRPAVVSLPLGATDRRPIIVVTHGAGGQPEGTCRHWRGIVGDRAFLLCPRGFPSDPYVPPDQTGYFYTTHHALAREITLALAALKARFPDHVDDRAPLYAGFSQGAIMGAMLLPSHPARFARAALIEGGYGFFKEWNVPTAEQFKRHGGVRVLFGCGRVRCVEQARTSVRYLARGGVEAKIVHAEGAGHTDAGAMEDEIKKAFAWLIEGDPRF